MFNLAVDWGMHHVSPCQLIPLFKENERTRHLSQAEAGARSMPHCFRILIGAGGRCSRCSFSLGCVRMNCSRLRRKPV